MFQVQGLPGDVAVYYWIVVCRRIVLFGCRKGYRLFGRCDDTVSLSLIFEVSTFLSDEKADFHITEIWFCCV
jgi:hypothetical protein